MARTPKSADTAPVNPDAPKGRMRQLWLVYKVTRKADRLLDPLLALAFFGTIGLGVVLGWLLNAWIYMAILSLPLAVLVAMIILARRAESAMYERAKGQPGGSLFALQNLRRGWSFDDKPVQLDPRTQDVVFRAVGRPGVVLLAEGPVRRIQPLVTLERRRLARVLGASVPVIVINVGEDEGQVPVRKVSAKLVRMRPVLTKPEVAAAYKRLRALGGVQPPIPKGVDPSRARPDRRTSRGR